MSSANWSAYEIFSVISGVIMIGAALLPGSKPMERLWAALGGAFFIGYGVFVAQQTSGVWTFPVIIFLLPICAVIYMGMKTYEFMTSRNSRDKSGQGQRVGSDADQSGTQQGW